MLPKFVHRMIRILTRDGGAASRFRPATSWPGLPRGTLLVDENDELLAKNTMEFPVPERRRLGRRVYEENRFGPNTYASRSADAVDDTVLSNADRLVVAGKWSTNAEIAAGRIITSQAGCWFWLGTLSSNGYGRVSRKVDGVRLSAVVHQLTWLEANGGPWPTGLIARHACRNRDCCSPEHITPGTPLDNIHDAQFRDGTMDVHISRFPVHLHERLRSGEPVEWEGQIWELDRQ